MSNVAEPPNPPNGLTIEDLVQQTAEVQRGVAEAVQTVIDRVDEKTEQIRTATVEQVEAAQINFTQQAAQAESDHRIDLLLERMGMNEARTKVEVNNKFNKYFLWMVMAFVILFIFSAVGYFQFLNPQPGQSVFVLSDVRVTGPTDLCPGENLKFEFDVTVRAVGVYQLYMSTWKVDPPPSTIIFSELQPFVIGSKRSFPIVREWKVPAAYGDPANSKDTPMVPGEYIRDISVVAVGKNTESTPLQVHFNVRPDCPKG